MTIKCGDPPHNSSKQANNGETNMTMEMSTFVEIAVSLPTNISVLVRGDHGIGKSEVIHQIGKLLGMTVIDRRLSQMSEGDVIGLPKLDDGVTKFMPVEFIKMACEKPVLLFLDEVNRASQEVQQAVFQLVLDRELNGNKLHPGTRVFAAVNTSFVYQVNEMDPALLDRFFVVDLRPSVQDWLTWARDGNVADVIVNFIDGNHKLLEVEDSSKIEPGKVTPSRRSWKRLSDSMKAMDIIDKPDDKRFYATTMGFVGVECATAFVKFAKTFEVELDAKKILTGGPELQKKLEAMSIATANACVGEFKVVLTKKQFGKKEMKNFTMFFEALPSELRVQLWHTVCVTQSKELLDMCKPCLLSTFNKTK